MSLGIPGQVRKTVIAGGNESWLDGLPGVVDSLAQASDGSYKLIDPAGLRAEPACDLGTIVRCNPNLGDDLWARTEQLASRPGVDATAIWEWGTIHRVVSGVYACSIGFQPFGDLLLAEADRLTA